MRLFRACACSRGSRARAAWARCARHRTPPAYVQGQRNLGRRVFRGGEMWTAYGRDADRKARRHRRQLSLARAGRTLTRADCRTSPKRGPQASGPRSHYGSRPERAREVPRGRSEGRCAPSGPLPASPLLFKEFVGTAPAAPPGLTGFAGAAEADLRWFGCFRSCSPKAEVAMLRECRRRAVPLDTAGRCRCADGPQPRRSRDGRSNFLPGNS